MTALWKGRLYTILGAASWGLSGVCGQYLMQTAQIPDVTSGSHYDDLSLGLSAAPTQSAKPR